MRGILVSVFVCLLPTVAGAEELPADVSATSLFGTEVERGGFHFQFALGVGGGPDSLGLFHAMEVGGTLDNGWTIALLHTFIQNKDVFGTTVGGPDLFGGWMAELKVPIFHPEIVGKVAAGLGGTHDQTDGIVPTAGFGWAYGIDFHIPFFRTSGATVMMTALHAVTPDAHHWGASLGIGYTWF